MPSRSGGLIAEKISSVIRRDLTPKEVLLCEQLVFNFFCGPIVTYIERLGRKPINHTFDGVYASVARGNMKGVRRGVRQHELQGTLLEAYQKLDLYHPGMNEGEIQSVIEISDKYSPAEIDRAIMIARSRGVQHVKYVLGICVGNANKPTERVKKQIEKFDDTVLRPSPAVVAKAWERHLMSAADQLQVNEASRMANDDISKR